MAFPVMCLLVNIVQILLFFYGLPKFLEKYKTNADNFVKETDRYKEELSVIAVITVIAWFTYFSTRDKIAFFLLFVLFSMGYYAFTSYRLFVLIYYTDTRGIVDERDIEEDL